jgi:hypothetical protein
MTMRDYTDPHANEWEPCRPWYGRTRPAECGCGCGVDACAHLAGLVVQLNFGHPARDFVNTDGSVDHFEAVPHRVEAGIQRRWRHFTNEELPAVEARWHSGERPQR